MWGGQAQGCSPIPWVLVSIIHWQLLTRGWNIYYLRRGFLGGSRVLYLFSFTWSVWLTFFPLYSLISLPSLPFWSNPDLLSYNFGGQSFCFVSGIFRFFSFGSDKVDAMVKASLFNTAARFHRVVLWCAHLPQGASTRGSHYSSLYKAYCPLDSSVGLGRIIYWDSWGTHIPQGVATLMFEVISAKKSSSHMGWVQIGCCRGRLGRSVGLESDYGSWVVISGSWGQTPCLAGSLLCLSLWLKPRLCSLCLSLT